MITYLVLALSISNIAGSVINIYKAQREGSLGRLYIGWISSLISCVVLVSHLERSMSQADFVFFNNLLEPRTILLWSMISNLFFLYPLLEYRADLISKQLFMKIFHPTLILGVLYFSFYWMDYPFTELVTWNDVVANIHLHDVQFRLLLMLVTVVLSITYLYIPFIMPRVNREPHVRKFSKWYYMFFIFGNILIVLYLLFSLIEAPELIATFRMSVLIFLNAITFTYMIPNVSLTRLRRRDPCNLKEYVESRSSNVDQSLPDLYKTIHDQIKLKQYYLTPM